MRYVPRQDSGQLSGILQAVLQDALQAKLSDKRKQERADKLTKVLMSGSLTGDPSMQQLTGKYDDAQKVSGLLEAGITPSADIMDQFFPDKDTEALISQLPPAIQTKVRGLQTNASKAKAINDYLSESKTKAAYRVLEESMGLESGSMMLLKTAKDVDPALADAIRSRWGDKFMTPAEAKSAQEKIPEFEKKFFAYQSMFDAYGPDPESWPQQARDYAEFLGFKPGEDEAKQGENSLLNQLSIAYGKAIADPFSMGFDKKMSDEDRAIATLRYRESLKKSIKTIGKDPTLSNLIQLLEAPEIIANQTMSEAEQVAEVADRLKKVRLYAKMGKILTDDDANRMYLQQLSDDEIGATALKMVRNLRGRE